MLRIARIALTLLAMACSSRGPAPPEPPAPRPVAVADAAVDAADTELARRKLDGWLAVFNGGRRDEILAFRERELSDEFRKNLPGPEGMMRFRAMIGGFDVVRVEETTPIRASVLVHLLTHTGGTGDIFGPEFDTHRLELKTLADYVKLYGKRDLAYEPGARWEYSNYGFLLLGGDRRARHAADLL